ncbi:MAG: AraC family transcriptional regulator [Ruminococcus sp.]|nr:AraC family transcriptional regulator [Ruminococcus sp.]MDY3845061.1 AraC family transcriptional regulator [Ruminococcus sp.]CDF02915.1 araC-type DNA-binding domain-containing proteins [Ruminococcus sp. CAG:624]
MSQNENDLFKSKFSKRIINTPSSAAKQTFFYMQETGYLKAIDAARSQRQNLDSYLIAAVVEGNGSLTISDKTYNISKGECFFIDCRTPHFYKSDENDPWEIVWIHFNGGMSQQYYELFLSQYKNVFKSIMFDRIVSVITEIININEYNDVNTEVITSKLIMELLTYVLTVNKETNDCDSALNKKLSAVYDYINRNFNSDISLDELSSQFYISKFYLTREFKKLYGKTIFQQIITARINYGKELLRFTDKTVEEIAHLCGFNDQSYFARQFKKIENLTCFSYRKMWRD